MKPVRYRGGALVAALAALAMVLSGCGTAPDTQPPAASSAGAATGSPAAGTTPSPSSPAAPPSATCTTASALAGWSLTRLAEQTVVVPVDESDVSRVTAEVQAGAGGIILFGSKTPTGFKTAPNLTTYNARFYEGRYVQGVIAAKMSKTGVAGYIVSFPIPEVVMGINAFLLGAQSINPDFKLKIVWVNSWFDPGKEADAAKALFDQGADIITQHTDSTAALQVAEERGLLGFGQSSDMIKFAPKAQLTSNTDNWGPYYVQRLKAVLDGTWKSDNVWLGIKDDAVKLAQWRRAEALGTISRNPGTVNPPAPAAKAAS